MPGNYAKPFRLPPPGAVPYSRPNHLSGCDVAPRYAQSTLVRASDGKTPPTIGSVAPFLRIDQTFDQGPSGSNMCPTAPPGTCGSWLLGGDLNGLSQQEITDTVNDILACGAGTVLAVDHNCYSKPGTSVSYKKCHKIGGKWVLGQKCWHGTFGWNSNDACAKNPNIKPDQTKYLAVTVNATSHVLTPVEGGGTTIFDSTATGTVSVNPRSGILTNTLWTTEHATSAIAGSSGTIIDFAGGAGDVTSITGELDHHYTSGAPTDLDYLCAADVHCGVLQTPGIFNANAGFDNQFGGLTLQEVVTTFNSVVAQFAGSPLPAVSDPQNYSGSGTITYAAGVSYLLNLSWSTTATVFTWSFDLTRSDGLAESKFSGTLTLSQPYTSSDCYQDWLDLMAEWDLTSDTLYPFRTDEELANAPLMLYDEVGPTSPLTGFLPATMDDYSGNLVTDVNGVAPGGDGYITTWSQRPWHDPNDYFWTYNGSVNGQPLGWTGGAGAVLNTPLRTGAMVTHNLAGSDRHFWFNYAHLDRIVNPDDGSVDWLVDQHGGYSDGNLPAATMRWLDNLAAQYDAAKQGAAQSQGNLPQAWLRESYGVLIGGKYVEAKELWPSVNFGRPYGADLFAVDQVTVCAIGSGTGAGGSLVVTPTLLAYNPLTPGGLAASGNVMIGGDGIYPVTGCTANGDGTWTLTVGTLLCAIPSGCDIGAGFVGMMRFWGAPPFGLMACSATYDGTADTNFVIPATPYWAAVGPGNPSLSVDLYWPDPDNGNPRTLLNTVTLTKYGAWAASTAFVPGQKILVNGQVQTATTGGTSGSAAPTWNTTVGQTTTDGGVTWTAGGMAPIGATAYAVGDFHTAAFIIPHLHYSGQPFLPEYDDNRPKGDFVQVQWGFDFRAEQTGYTGTVPTWNGASLTPPNPQPGELPAQVADATLRFTPCCPSVVGFVPFYSLTGPVEHFRNQKLGPFPPVFLFDDSFFSFWMGTVATAMVDPFWQTPFAPETEAQLASDDGFQWRPDDGSGLEDNLEGTPPVRYYPAPPLVEARATKPGNLGWGQNETPPDLPAGVTLAYDVTKNVVTPQPVGPPNGIPIGDATGAYGNVATIYGFYLNACANIAANGRFSQYYKLFCYC